MTPNGAHEDLPTPEEALTEFLERRRKGEHITLDAYSSARGGLSRAILDTLSTWRSELRSTTGRDAPDTTASARKLSFGDFDLLREIGRGGMGVVYEGEQRSLRRRVAVKFLPETFADDPKRRALFESESQSLARIRHSRVVEIHAAGHHEGRPYIVMEYLDGESLGSRLETIRSIPAARRKARDLLDQDQADSYITVAVRMVVQILDAVSAIHSEGIVHRDIKPDNIIIQNDGTLKLADFGLAKDLMSASGQTSIGEVRGTPCYMSPEQAAGNLMGLDHRSDLFSVGVILFELVCAEVPFSGENWQKVIAEILTKPTPRPRKLNPAVTRDLAAVIGKALEKNPEHRYQTAEAFAGDLSCLLDRKPIVHGRPTLRDRWRKSWAVQSPLARAGAYALSLAAALVVAMFALEHVDPWPSILAIPMLLAVTFSLLLFVLSLFHRGTSRLLPSGVLGIGVLGVAGVALLSSLAETPVERKEAELDDALADGRFEHAIAVAQAIPFSERRFHVQKSLIYALWSLRRYEEGLAAIERGSQLDRALNPSLGHSLLRLSDFLSRWHGWGEFFRTVERDFFAQDLEQFEVHSLARASRLLFVAGEHMEARRYANAAVRHRPQAAASEPKPLEAEETLARLELVQDSAENALESAERIYRNSVYLPVYRPLSEQLGHDPFEWSPRDESATVRTAALLFEVYRRSGREAEAVAFARSVRLVVGPWSFWLPQLAGLVATASETPDPEDK